VADVLRLHAFGLADEDVFPCFSSALRNLARLISMRGLLALIDAHGGRRVYVSQSLKKLTSSKLARVLSRKDLSALHTEYQGQTIAVPLGGALLNWARAQQVVALRAAGLAVSDVASRLAMSERHVWRLSAQHRQTLQRRSRPSRDNTSGERIAR
jgi:hypothetical protein